MTKPENFIMNTDYATLKNDAKTTFALTLTGGQVIGAGATLRVFSTQAIGVAGASERALIHSSKETNYWVGNILTISRTGLVSGTPAAYQTVAELYRNSATELTAQVTIFNPYASALTAVSGDEVFTFVVSTFVPPFA